MFKTDLAISRMRVRVESTIRRMLFIFLISPIMQSALMRGKKPSGLMNSYLQKKMLLEIEKPHLVEDANNSMSEL